MTADDVPAGLHPGSQQGEVVRTFYQHSSASRVNTDAVIVEALRAEYPQLHITVVPVIDCDVVAFASSGGAGVAPIDEEKDRLWWKHYTPPPSRLSGKPGRVQSEVIFGKFLLDWSNKEYVVYIVDGRDGGSAYPIVKNQYILSPSEAATDALVLAAGSWTNELHDEIWVFDGGRWRKNAELWDSVQKARWEDVILDHEMKKAIVGDVSTFFDARDTYERLRVPWKRGVIYYGPPGNGKTISIKAMMHTLYNRKDPVQTLYVRTLSSFAGPEYSLGLIFNLARRVAPCLLVFEDLDSIVTDNVRSYFLNEVDGIRKNDGIFMVGSTNHLDRLDPGISKRPSRFDRKYLFPNPDEKERTAYLKFWQTKLADNKDLGFPDEICPATARITDGFSFAYLQEVMVASLLAIARADDPDETPPSDALLLQLLLEKGTDRLVEEVKELVPSLHSVNGGGDDLDKYPLWRQIKKQVKLLRDEIDDSDEAARRRH